MKHIIIILIALGIIALSATIYSVNAQIEETITRREYVYCPVDTSALDKTVTYEINGCPTVRIYVENYDRLTIIQKSDIDAKLRADGFLPKEESEINEIDGRITTNSKTN